MCKTHTQTHTHKQKHQLFPYFFFFIEEKNVPWSHYALIDNLWQDMASVNRNTYLCSYGRKLVVVQEFFDKNFVKEFGHI